MSNNLYNEIKGREINFALSENTRCRMDYLGFSTYDDTVTGASMQIGNEVDYEFAKIGGDIGEGFHYYFSGETNSDGDILVSDDDYAAAAPISFTATNAIGGNGVIQVKNSILLVNEQSATPAADQSANFMVMKYKTI